MTTTATETLRHFDAARPKVCDALRILRLSRMPKDTAELRSRCTGLYVTGTPEEGGDTWISDSMHAAERNMAADAYRWLRGRIQAA